LKSGYRFLAEEWERKTWDESPGAGGTETMVDQSSLIAVISFRRMGWGENHKGGEEGHGGDGTRGNVLAEKSHNPWEGIALMH